MAFIYDADDGEAALLRELFGPTVTEVVFYDYDFPDEQEANWEQALATLADGSEISLDPTHERWREIEDLCSERGQTVKFVLTLPEPEQPTPDFSCAECGTTEAETYVVTGPAQDGEDRTEVCLACHRTLDTRPVTGQFTPAEVETLLHTAAELHDGVEPDDLSDLQTSLLARLVTAWRAQIEEPTA